MITISFLLIVLALICFAASAAGVQSKINLESAGLFCWLLSQVVRA